MKKTLLTLSFSMAAVMLHAQWQPDVRITNFEEASNPCYNDARSIAASGNNVYLTWSDERITYGEIFFNRSTDGGATWGTDTRLTNDADFSMTPAIAASGSTIHIAWMDKRDGNLEIYYKRSADGGATWSADTRLTNDGEASQSPSIAVSGSDVHLVWYDERDGNREIYYKHSSDGGLNWGADTRLTNDGNASYYPSVAVSGSSVHVVWYDTRNQSTGEIYYKLSTNGGTSWGSDVRLTNEPDDSIDPTVSASGSVVHVTWVDGRDGNGEIYYKRSTDGGNSWEADVRVTSNSSDSKDPSTCASGNVIQLVWADYRDNNFEIYYKRSTDQGVTWSSSTRLTDDPAASQRPSVAVAGTAVHVAWMDYRDSNQEIYYKQDPTGSPIGIEELANSGIQIGLYPNPASGLLHVYFKNTAGEKLIASVRNVIGEELITTNVTDENFTIDVTGLAKGFYFVNIESAKGKIASAKLLIER